MTRVPVIAVTGYLGSGKTSVVNHLLRRPGARLGVVVNDFGELNVDAALVTGQIDEAAAISGGCLCCLPDAGGLDEALEHLAHPRLRLDAVLLEASGAADPIALARLLRFSGVERIRPGGVVEVIDALEHFRTVDVRPEPPAHYRAATLVVLAKTDLIAPGDREQTVGRISDRVRQCNPHAQIVTARHGRLDPALVFDTAADEDPADQLPIARLAREAAMEAAREVPGDHAEEDHEHARAASVPLPRTGSPTALVDLLERPPSGCYRLKGRIRVRGLRGDRGYLVNVVGTAIHVASLPAPPATGELVAIGMHLDPIDAEQRLRAVARTGSERPDTAGLKRLSRYRRLSD